jgi:hypothetical protein
LRVQIFLSYFKGNSRVRAPAAPAPAAPASQEARSRGLGPPRGLGASFVRAEGWAQFWRHWCPRPMVPPGQPVFTIPPPPPPHPHTHTHARTRRLLGLPASGVLACLSATLPSASTAAVRCGASSPAAPSRRRAPGGCAAARRPGAAHPSLTGRRASWVLPAGRPWVQRRAAHTQCGGGRGASGYDRGSRQSSRVSSVSRGSRQSVEGLVSQSRVSSVEGLVSQSRVSSVEGLVSQSRVSPVALGGMPARPPLNRPSPAPSALPKLGA